MPHLPLPAAIVGDGDLCLGWQERGGVANVA